MADTATTGATTLADRPETDGFDEFALDVRVVVTAHPNRKLMCTTSDGCGTTCSNGASACNSFIDDPA